MIYFFHHYELPVIIQQAQVQQILRLRTRQRHQQQNGNGTPHGASNTATNMQNGSNAANQANNNATGNNQMNNNGNQPNNNNHRNGNLFTSISLIFNVQMLTTLFNHIWNAFGALQGRITNDVFGAAAFFNNNNDNRLNNNNNPTANITRLRINLSRLRRINLAGIQINPADGVESVHRIDRDEIDGDSPSTAAAATAATAAVDENNSSTANHSNVVNNHTMAGNDRRPAANEYEFNIQHEFGAVSTDDTDFDIIDANDGIEIKQNDKQSNEKTVTLNSFNSSESNGNVFDGTNVFTQVAENPSNGSNERPNDADAFKFDEIQLQTVTNSSNTKNESCSTANTDVKSGIATNALYIANELNLASSNSQHDERLLQQSNDDTVPYVQIRSLENFPNESFSWIQGDKPENSLTNTNIGICTESDGLLAHTSTYSVAKAPPKLGVSDESTSKLANDVRMKSNESTSDLTSTEALVHAAITTTATNNDEQNIESDYRNEN